MTDLEYFKQRWAEHGLFSPKEVDKMAQAELAGLKIYQKAYKYECQLLQYPAPRGDRYKDVPRETVYQSSGVVDE